MIRKIKTILNKESHHSSCVGGSSSSHNHHHPHNTVYNRYDGYELAAVANESTNKQSPLRNSSLVPNTATAVEFGQVSKSTNGSPVNYIKRKIRSTKSWVKMPSVRHNSTSSSSHDNNNKMGLVEKMVSSTYDNSIDQEANNEFERFTRVLTSSHEASSVSGGGTNQLLLQSSNPPPPTKPIYSIDYGFDLTSSLSPSLFTTSNTIASSMNTNNNNRSNSSSINHHSTSISTSSSTASSSQQLPQLQSTLANNHQKEAMLVFSENMKSNEDLLYEHVLNRLAQASIDSPAHVPLLCVSTFSSTLGDHHHHHNHQQANDYSAVLNRLSALGINVRLIDLLVKGVPVNALFYLSNLDLVYVRTAEEIEGYVPRECCRPVSISCNCSSLPVITRSNPLPHPPLVATTTAPTTHFNDQYFVPIPSNNNENNESIKYHSLSSSEYDDLIETSNNSSSNGAAGCMSSNSFKAIRDSGYKSDAASQEAATAAAESSVTLNILNTAANTPSSSKKLEKMPSRSRLPVTIAEGSNLNLTLIDRNTNYKLASPMPPPLPRPRQNCTPNPLVASSNASSESKQRSDQFQRAKNTRRSLDSNLANNNNKNKFYAVPIDFSEKQSSSDLSELDLKKIELDSLDVAVANDGRGAGTPKLCRVVARHDARNFQELNVMPGMLVNVLKVFTDRIYVQLAGMEHSNLDMSQQHGILPRDCVDLRFIDHHDLHQADTSSFLINSINRIKYTPYGAAANGSSCVSNFNRRKSQQITAL